tara:strand:+ start:1509 stop:1685 length:177 start_codon:yes stop_codon:yes gene_type:complete
MSPDPTATVERTVRRSRIAEAVAVLTVVAAMTGALATMASNMFHDYAAVRIAEAKKCP